MSDEPDYYVSGEPGRYAPMVYSVVYAAVVLGVILPLAYVSTLAASLLAWLSVPGVAVVFIQYNRRTLFYSYRRHAGPIGFVGFIDMYIFVNLAFAIVWQTLWLLDTSVGRDAQLRIEGVPASGADLHFVFLVLFANVAGVFSGVGLEQVVPVSVAAHLWYLLLVFSGILWITIVGQWLIESRALYVYTRQQQQRK